MSARPASAPSGGRRARAALVAGLVAVALGTTACELRLGGQRRVSAREACEQFDLTIAAAARGVITHDEMVTKLEAVHSHAALATTTLDFSADQMVRTAKSGESDAFLRAVADMTLSCDLSGN